MRAGAMCNDEPHRAAAIRLHVAFLPAPIAVADLGNRIEEASKAVGLSAGKDYELLVSPTRILLQWLASSPLPEDVEQGVLFGPTGQVEFREVSPGLFRIVAFREDSPLTLADWQAEDVQLLKDGEQPEQFLLWGVAMDKGKAEWQEGRIPHPQSYPWRDRDPVPARLAVVGVVYRDPVSRLPLYVRWTGLQEAQAPHSAATKEAETARALGEEG